MARAKQTDRAEARRRFRQATAEPTDDAAELDYGERRTDIGAGKSSSESTARPASTRPGFGSAFRAAYHPPNLREDLRQLPRLLRTRAFLGGVGLVLVGAVVSYIFWNYSGGRVAWELVVLPGSALAPQLVAGFFAPRASYLLGFIVGVIQGIAATLFITILGARLGIPMASDQMGNLLMQAFLTGPVTGSIFAAAAAWYRRFLALSSPRRSPAGRSPAKSNSSRRPAGR